jgi:hypothetical protein
MVAKIDGARSNGGPARFLFLGSGAGHQGTRRAVQEEAGRGEVRRGAGAKARRAGHFCWRRALGRRAQAAGAERGVRVTVRVLVMLDMYFVSVKYVFDSIKLMCVCVKLLKI